MEKTHKRKRIEQPPTKGLEYGEVAKDFLQVLSQITSQVALLEKTLKEAYKPKTEYFNISNRLSLQVDKLRYGSLRTWINEVVSVNPDSQKDLHWENQKLRKQVRDMEVPLNGNIEENCESCKKAQTASSRRKFLKAAETYDNLRDVTEDDWASSVFPVPNIEVGQIWDAPNDTGIILVCNRNIKSGEDSIKRAIEKFGSREGLQLQEKVEGEVAMMCHSFGFPNKDGNVNQKTRWLHYPITGEHAGKDDQSYKQLFKSLVTIKQHAMEQKIKKLAIPKMMGVSGVVTTRIMIYLLADTDIQLTIYKWGHANGK